MTAAKAIREIRVTNTLSGKKEVLQTAQPGKLTFYSCGPTVYGLIHIGNLRSGLVADMFYRYFKRVGYDVNYVRNYTDVDDKIINKAREEGASSDVVARRFTQEVEKDYAVAGMEEPTHKTKATEHIGEMIALIEKIIAHGKAYVVNGEVLFAVGEFQGYGKLSKKKLEDLIAGARVEVDEKKRNPADFALWKPAKPGEPSWESPWGAGRPGWHIECSAMASKWLGDQIDVHHGGEDLIFPHHENEIAQSEAACGKAPFVRYWLHHAFLTFSKEKMSKSLGNVLSAREFLTQFSGEVARYMLLSVHYRSIIDFSDDTIDQALNSLQRIYEAKARAVELRSKVTFVPDQRAESAWGSFLAECEKVRRDIDEAYANDFNTPGVLAALFTLIREYNRTLKEPRGEATPGVAIGSGELIKIMEDEIGGVLGIGRQAPDRALADLQRIRRARPVVSVGSGAAGAGVRAGEGSRPEPEEIERLIQERLDARKAKDFKRADEIRNSLASRGVVLKDGPGGTTWEYR